MIERRRQQCDNTSVADPVFLGHPDPDPNFITGPADPDPKKKIGRNSGSNRVQVFQHSAEAHPAFSVSDEI